MFPSVYLKERSKEPEDLEHEDDVDDDVDSEPEDGEIDGEHDDDRRGRTPSPGLEHIERQEKNKRKRTPANVKFNRAYEVSKSLPELMALYDDATFTRLEGAMQRLVHLRQDGFSEDLLEYLLHPGNYEIYAKNGSNTEQHPHPGQLQGRHH